MSFIKPGSSFPPKEWSYFFNKFKEWKAWYSGDPLELLNLYSTMLLEDGINENSRFWARIEKEERAGVVHIPLAGDISAMSANLLFSETPRIRYDEGTKGGERIKQFIDDNGFFNILLEGAELAGAFGGCFLKIDTEPELLSSPLVSIITPLQAFPTFWRGRLWEVLFFRTVKETDGGSVWRLFENRRRSNGKLVIEYKLYKGTSDKVGYDVPLESIQETEMLGLEDKVLNVDGLGCVYIPNMRPNKLVPGSPIGINDFGTSITLLDSLDFTWTSWMRDIELGMAQIFVDAELLDTSNPDDPAIYGGGRGRMKFNKFQKAFTELNLAPWRFNGEHIKPINEIQFDIRVEEHYTTCKALIEEIISQCGYSPQSFGSDIQGRAESGTALRIRERKSLLTREKKSRYWQPEIRSLLNQVQQIDIATGLSSSYEIQDIGIELEDSIIVDPLENSETIRNLDQARAVSVLTKVRILHPEWDDEEVEKEVEKILKEQGMAGMPFAEDV